MDVTINQLRTFREVARQEQFTRAAEVLFVSQPAVSKSVKDLERQVGGPLFEPIGRRVQLTQTGHLLLPYAERVLVELEDAIRALKAHHTGDQGRLVIGASHTAGTYIVPRFFAEFHQQYPRVELSLDVSATYQALEALLDGRIDLAVVGEAAFEPSLIAENLCRENLVLITSPEHPLGQRGSVTLSELADQPFIMRQKGSSTRESLQRAFSEKGFRPLVCIELGSAEAVKKMVAAGSFVSFASEHEIELEILCGVLSAHLVEELDLGRGIFIVRRASFQLTVAHRRFIQLLRDAAALSCPTMPALAVA